ncbi:MAG TPA: hypothetical protein VNZ53_17115 [Steroidobacteraceae bacterium]|nr:hypothetical protein [Steroidobacteraceae bacterium]
MKRKPDQTAERQPEGVRPVFEGAPRVCQPIATPSASPSRKLAPTILEMAQLIAARVAASLGSHPQVVAKLATTGFDLHYDAVVDELDQVVAFCGRQAGESAT